MKRVWLPLGLFVVLVVFLGVGLTLNPREVPSPLIGKPAPYFRLPQLHQADLQFSQKDMAGRVWLLNVWASWCVTCRQEHSVLMDFAKRGVAPLYGLNYIFFVLLMMLMPSVAAAVTAAPAMDDPALERRVQSLSEELRCLVCQNQSLADSHADLAVDLKNQAREKLRQGASEQQVIDYMVERYGDFVRYRPPVKASTLLLWFGPGLLLAAGLGALFMRLRHANRTSVDVPLSAEDQTRAKALPNAAPDFLSRRR